MPGEQIARDIARQRAVVRTDEQDAPARRGRRDDVEQRDVRRIETQDGVVHLRFVAGHEHHGVGLLGDGALDQRDLLRHAVGHVRDIVRGRRAEPRGGAVGAEPRRGVGRVGAVLGEDGDARHSDRRLWRDAQADLALARSRLVSLPWAAVGATFSTGGTMAKGRRMQEEVRQENRKETGQGNRRSKAKTKRKAAVKRRPAKKKARAAPSRSPARSSRWSARPRKRRNCGSSWPVPTRSRIDASNFARRRRF